MTDSDNSQPQNDSDIDIYKDIPEFNFEDELAKLEGSKETYKQEANDLSEKVKVLTEENKELKKSNEVLKKNLSTLLKTAQAEVQRKDSMINELRNKVESSTFRKNKNITKDKYTSTDDLNVNRESKHEPEKLKSTGDKKRSKSYENRTSSDSERKIILEEKRKDFSTGKEVNINCDNDRKSSYYKGIPKANSKHSETSRDSRSDRHKDRKSTWYEDCSSHRKSYRENHRDHLKYDPFDKKRHSRSSDRRFLYRFRNSRERRSDRERNDSSERRKRRRSSESCERSSKRKSRKVESRSPKSIRGSKERSLEKTKTRSSLEKDAVIRSKEQNDTKLEVSHNFNTKTDTVENKKRTENSEKRTSRNDAANNVKSKQSKEKHLSKHEKRSNSDIFSAKSPLDALYNDMVTSRNSNRFAKAKSDTPVPESDFDEDEVSLSQVSNECLDNLENQLEEDWALSFKNERQIETKPMTLYSKRMMRKFSLELKNTERPENKEEKVSKEKSEKYKEDINAVKAEVEKEPGELTDDENIVESSKEFQELTKVASIENAIIENSVREKACAEPVEEESLETGHLKTESALKENHKEIDTANSAREEPIGSKEIEPNKDICEVMEFSPFKQNYKLIEISPVKPKSGEHVLDFYNKRGPRNQSSEQNIHSSLEEKTVSEKNTLALCRTSEENDLWKNSSSEKDSETELKIIMPSSTESPRDKEKKPEKREEKKSRKKQKKTESKTCVVSKAKNNAGKEKLKFGSKEATENPDSGPEEDKYQKRKRKFSRTEEGDSDPKKLKIDKSQPSRKSTRSKRSSKSEPDSEPEKIKEDISSFEFFKPVSIKENSKSSIEIDKSICTTADYKMAMTATMSVTGMVRLETPNKCMEKLKNLMINEQMILNVLDSKSNSQFSPLIGSKCIEMTPRRMLRNDLMLTDSEDDSITKQHVEEGEDKEPEQEEIEEEEDDEEENEIFESENSECDSDSGASDFVDLL